MHADMRAQRAGRQAHETHANRAVEIILAEVPGADDGLSGPDDLVGGEGGFGGAHASAPSV
ncbi:hypothetical protein A3862_16180 [Methylobacterium sp. XJLW]|nr:hypothetical protein A3862_16180 [Methylobacterium sp. XJLW]